MNKVYVIEHAPDGDVFREYSGMAEDVVAALLAELGNPFDVVTEEEFLAQSAVSDPYGEPE